MLVNTDLAEVTPLNSIETRDFILLASQVSVNGAEVGKYNQFLAVRALFGIAMSGTYGNAAATALEDIFGSVD